MPPSAQEVYPLSYPIIARLAKDIKQHTRTSSSPSPSPSPAVPAAVEAFSDHSLYVLGSNVERIKKDVSDIRSDIRDLKRSVSSLEKNVSDINWRLSDTKNRDWNGMATRNYDLLKPVPHYDNFKGVLVDPPRGLWPKSLGRLIKMRNSGERGLLKLRLLLEFYGFEGHGLWYSTGDSDSESDYSEDEGETSPLSRKGTRPAKPPVPPLQDAIKAHPDKAMHAFCHIIGVRTEVVESNQFYHDFQALRDIILKRPAASEGSPAAAKKVRMGGGHSQEITTSNNNNAAPTTPPIRIHKRSPEFRQLIYEALQPKPSPVSTVKTAETHISWGTPEAERLRRRRQLFGLADVPPKEATLASLEPAAAAQFPSTTSALPQASAPVPAAAAPEDREEIENLSPASTPLSQHDEPSSSQESERPRDTVDHLYEAIGIESAGLISGDVSRLHQNVFTISFDDPSLVNPAAAAAAEVPALHHRPPPTVATEKMNEEHLYKSFASGTTEEDPDMHYRSS